MKKLNSLNKLGKTRSHRKSLLANLSIELLLHKRIKTTEAKAKAMRSYIEKIITRAKTGTQHAQREIFKKIKSKQAIKILFTDIVAKVGSREGGYTRIIKLPPRLGDAAKIAFIELVDYGEAPQKTQKQKQDRSKRVKGSKAKLKEKNKTSDKEKLPERIVSESKSKQVKKAGKESDHKKKIQ